MIFTHTVSSQIHCFANESCAVEVENPRYTPLTVEYCCRVLKVDSIRGPGQHPTCYPCSGNCNMGVHSCVHT